MATHLYRGENRPHQQPLQHDLLGHDPKRRHECHGGGGSIEGLLMSCLPFSLCRDGSGILSVLVMLMWERRARAHMRPTKTKFCSHGLASIITMKRKSIGREVWFSEM